jgi:hypothetical protein
MKQGQLFLMLAAALSACLARGEMPPTRPDLEAATPIATCELQTVTAIAQGAYEQSAVLYSLRPPAEDPLANYERTPLGDWQMPADADRSDPWLRLLLVAPARPVVIDLAVFIDGKSFRDQREAWIDEVITAAKSQESNENVDGNKAGEASGTNGTDSASVGDADSTPPSGESPPLLGGPTVAAQARQAPTMRERLLNYLATSGEVQRDELHWLLAEWGAGPGVVVLDPSLSWQRAGLAPLLACLDQDADGGLSAKEISQAAAMLQRADADGNDVVEVSELRRQTDRPATFGRATGHSLVVMLDQNTEWEMLSANLLQVYGSSAAIATDAQALCSVPADVTLRVNFSTTKVEEDEPSRVALVAVAAELAANDAAAAVASKDVISIAAGGDFVEVSAAQSPADAKNDATASQLAIGAVVDGNPLERLLDRDQDGRFTHRERQELGGLLAALDRDQDGQLAADEVPVSIRLAVTLGPHVHQLLAAPTGSARVIAPREAATTPPDWFASMDKNGDRDLARGEFLGTTEQFRQFDTNGDGLLSVAEALKLNGTQ